MILNGTCQTLPLGEADRLFFKGGFLIVEAAKAVCAECPAQPECLALGMSAEFGIFGGLTPAERDRLDPGRLG
jgi:hypothetical protein